MVFAHYMLLTRPPNGDYIEDFKQAAATGIDAFAVNFGGWGIDWNQQKVYLADMYAQAAQNNFKLFISIDTTSVTDVNMVVQLVSQYAVSPAQLYFNGQSSTHAKAALHVIVDADSCGACVCATPPVQASCC